MVLLAVEARGKLPMHLSWHLGMGLAGDAGLYVWQLREVLASGCGLAPRQLTLKLKGRRAVQAWEALESIQLIHLCRPFVTWGGGLRPYRSSK